LHTGKYFALLFLDMMVDRLDQFIERCREFGGVWIHRGHLFEHVLGLGVLSLAMGDLLGLSSLVLGDGIHL